MAKTSKKYFAEDFRKEIWKPFLLEIKQAQTHKDIFKALDLILTPQEKIISEKRLAARFLLKEGKSFGNISKTVDISKSMVSFIKKSYTRTKPSPKKEVKAKEPDLLEDFFGGDEGLFRKHRYIR